MTSAGAEYALERFNTTTLQLDALLRTLISIADFSEKRVVALAVLAFACICLLKQLVRELGLGAFPNVNYIKAMKAAVGMEAV